MYVQRRDHRPGRTLPRGARRRCVLAQYPRRRGIDHVLQRRGIARGGCRRKLPGVRTLCEGRCRDRGCRSVRCTLFQPEPERGPVHRSPAAAVPRMRGRGAGQRRLRSRPLRRGDRRVCRIRAQLLRARGRVFQLRSAGDLRRPADAVRDRRRQRLPGHACVVQAELARAWAHDPDRLLHVAGRGSSGLPEPTVRRMRRGAGGRRVDPEQLQEGRLFPHGRRHGVGRRPLPAVRRRSRRHDLRRRPGHRGAQAARQGAGRWRQHPRGDPRHGDQ